MTPAQARSQIRQAQQKQRQAVNKINSAIRQYNRDQKRAVDGYNREVRAYNAGLRANKVRRQQELSRLKASLRSTEHVSYRVTVDTLQRSFLGLETAAETGRWTAGQEIFDLSEGETANGVAALNSLLDPSYATSASDETSGLQTTKITDQLLHIDADLEARWRGALYALDGRNPDAARHFCTSSREILSTILERAAPDAAIKAALPDYDTTPNGGVARRARIRYCLASRGSFMPELEAFVDADLEAVLALFREFNDGTHGSAGHFTIAQLTSLKTRVEDAILFLHEIVRVPAKLGRA